MRHVWKIQVLYKRWSFSSDTYEVHVAASTIEEALARAYTAAWKAKRWGKNHCDAKFVERLDLKVFV
jgi:hypothetical protein